jgi:hypothetical protein
MSAPQVTSIVVQIVTVTPTTRAGALLKPAPSFSPQEKVVPVKRHDHLRGGYSCARRGI